MPPEVTTAPRSEIAIDDPFEAVWDRLVGRLATGFFVINNIDKASRLINVSYSGDSPGQFIDCGTSTRHFSFDGKSHTYTYKVADSSTYKVTKSWGPMHNLPIVQEILRRTSVEGRINLYVAPISANKRKVSANVKYAFQVSVSGTGTAYNTFGEVVNQIPTAHDTDEVSFTTAEVGSKDWSRPPDTERITCQTTGKLEQMLLDKAKP